MPAGRRREIEDHPPRAGSLATTGAGSGGGGKEELPDYDREALDGNFLRRLAGLSSLAEGPRLAREALEDKGIAVVIEAHLDQTHLDGAAMLVGNDRPVIGLTLRHDRLDNFWFTLFHEIGHVLKHLSPENPAILDVDIDRKKTGPIDTEADRFAMDTLIPPGAWKEQVRLLHYPDHGEDSPLYRAMGFVPFSERSSGLSPATRTPTPLETKKPPLDSLRQEFGIKTATCEPPATGPKEPVVFWLGGTDHGFAIMPRKGMEKSISAAAG